MELKDYREQPDEGLFEQIQHRLRVRRAWRVGGGVAAVVIVAAVVAAVALSGGVGESVVPRQSVAVNKTPSMDNPADVQVQPVAVEPRHTAPVAKTDVAAREQPAITVMPDEEPLVQTQQQPDRVEKMDVDMLASSSDDVPNHQPAPTTTYQPVNVSVAKVADVVEDDATPEEEPSVQPSAKNEVNPVVPVHYDNILWAPNVIFPNGDVEANRTFSFKYTSPITDLRLFIYNRGGRRLFSTSNPEFVWDGTVDGTALPQGAYVWVARFRDTDGRQREEKGTVTIIR